jgi:hypothetical protein
LKASIHSKIVNGKCIENKESINKAFEQYEGKEVKITIEERKATRSTEQNNYLWGVIYPLLKKGFFDTQGEVYSIEQIHEAMKQRYNYIDSINKQTGDFVRLPKSTTKNNTKEQEAYHEELRRFALEWFNINIPLPNEKIILNS